MIDTHTHLYMEEYEEGGKSAVERATDAGVELMILPCVDAASLEPMERLHSLFPESTRIAIGLHPTELGENPEKTLDDFERRLEENASRFCAIGETGIDLHWDKTNLEAQKEAFRRQYIWAQKYDLPLIIHCREGVEAALEVISSVPGKKPVMIFHSFTSGPEDVRRIREVCDPWFGINGVVTFKNAEAVRDAAKEIGLERIVLETDAPFLSPVPFRGARNESAYLDKIRDKLAEVFEISPVEVERVTDANAKLIFRLHSPKSN